MSEYFNRNNIERLKSDVDRVFENSSTVELIRRLDEKINAMSRKELINMRDFAISSKALTDKQYALLEAVILNKYYKK